MRNSDGRSSRRALKATARRRAGGADLNASHRGKPLVWAQMLVPRARRRRGRPPAPLLVESSFSIHALVRASPELSLVPSPLPAANTDATGMCGLELVHAGRAERRDRGARSGADGKIMHSHGRSASAAVWTPFRPVGDDGAEARKFASGPTVVRAADGRLEVVARGMDGALYVKYQLPRRARLGAVGARRRRAGVCGRAERGAVGGGLPAALRAVGIVGRDHVHNGQLRNASGVYWSGWRRPRRLLRRRAVGRPRRGVAPPRLRRRRVGRAAGECGGVGAAVGRLLVGRLDLARRRRVLSRASPSSSTAPTCSRSTRRAPPTAPSPSSASRRRRCASARNPPRLPCALAPHPTPPSPPPGDERLALRRRLADGVDRARRAARARGLAHRARRRASDAQELHARTAAGGVAASAQFAHPLVDAATAGGAARQWAPWRVIGAGTVVAAAAEPAAVGAGGVGSSDVHVVVLGTPTAARATPSAPRTPARPPPPSAPPTRRSRRRRARGAAEAQLPDEGSGCGRTRGVEGVAP